ncbi:hypothetical protein H4219_006002, partial [Mycoemilia scoparia]
HGTVIRTSPIRPLLVEASFKCNKCNVEQTIPIIDGKFTSPTKCIRSGCRSKIFIIDKSAGGNTKTINWQKIRLQEKIDDSKRSDQGRVPRTVEAELVSDLVDSVVPGDVVNLTGIVKVVQSNEGMGARNKQNSMYVLYIDANSINKSGSENNNDSDDQGDSTMDGLYKNSSMSNKEDVHFTQKELEFVRAIFKEPNIFKLLVHSFCPSIFGHEMVKAGLLLSLFGGRKRVPSDHHAPSGGNDESTNTLSNGGQNGGNNNTGSTGGFINQPGGISIRSDAHVLVVGDPGLGKSQMLSSAVNIAPRGVYVCGSSGVSANGLTVTLVRESGSGDFALEAGALVLSDQGCCCIDEFDKITSDHCALLEAMEQQTVSIAKAGIICSLPARTSVIAAANPIHGHYNKAKSVAENLKMNSALLSRFDLIFILLDKPDADLDMYLSEHVMALHSGIDQSTRNTWGNQQSGSLSQDEALESSLKVRLMKRPGELIDPIPVNLLRKYVAYCRKYVHPRISEKAADVIQTFYLNLRKKHQEIDSTPITTRQIEAMIRLSEARARAELREEVTERDAADIVELM